MKINTNTWNRIRYTLFMPGYDLLAKPFQKLRERSICLLFPQADDKVLILGAGTGLDLYYLRRCEDITAIDITPAMINRLKSRARELDMNVDARVMDGQKLEFADDTFDCIVLHLIIAVIPDPCRCIKEAERVLKPGGRIIILDKFLPDNEQPSLLRKLGNVFTNLMFTDITRRSADIIGCTRLEKTLDVDAALGGMFRIIKLEKLGILRQNDKR